MTRKNQRFYRNLGAKAVITKVGSQGAYVTTETEEYLVPGFKVDKVVDTVGAGDGFAAGVITALMEGLPLKKLSAVVMPLALFRLPAGETMKAFPIPIS